MRRRRVGAGHPALFAVTGYALGILDRLPLGLGVGFRYCNGIAAYPAGLGRMCVFGIFICAGTVFTVKSPF
ncbi:MAG: hypothetical protein M0Z68_08305 [Gammaproteobacteria bacterium]|jgi:hypothetical protein|nr:hypothetical protein [Gammaproteobacteria bacterium]